MEDRIQINDDITVGAQPSEEEFKVLAQTFRSVINLRTSDEEPLTLEPDEEADVVQGLGLTYHHLPVSSDTMSEGQVDRFREILHETPKPVYVHCRSGKRSGAFTMMDVATRRGMSGEETLQKAEAMGFECDTEHLEQFVRKYVDARTDGA